MDRRGGDGGGWRGAERHRRRRASADAQQNEAHSAAARALLRIISAHMRGSSFLLFSPGALGIWWHRPSA